ncbi:MAG: hypothetical protein ACR2FY_21500 [Pirellulaceae bacterium]
MFLTALRSIGAVITGLVVAFVLLAGIEVFSNVFHPFPPGVDPTDMEVCKAHVAQYPTSVLAVGATGWGLTVALSTALATRLGMGRHPAHGIVVGLLLYLAAIVNVLMLPYATWFEVFCFVVLPLCIFAGVRLGRGAASPANSGTPNLNG